MKNKGILLYIRGIVPLVILGAVVYTLDRESTISPSPPSRATSFWDAMFAPLMLGLTAIFMARFVMKPLFRLLRSLIRPIFRHFTPSQYEEFLQKLPIPEEYAAIMSQPMIFGSIALGMYMAEYSPAAWGIVLDGFLTLMFLSLARNMYRYGKTATL